MSKQSDAANAVAAELSRISGSRKSQKEFHKLFAKSMTRDAEAEWKKDVEEALDMIQQRLDKIEGLA